MKKILANMRRAISNFKMIENGDKIAVGVSGGKDSTLLLKALHQYKIFAKEKFEILGIYVDLGFEPKSQKELDTYFNYLKQESIPYVVEKTNIKEVVFDIRQEPNPCSLCAKMRRGTLNTVAIKHKCNKLALGHTTDDLINTFFLSLLYEGRLSTIHPTGYMSRTDITLIRPFIYLDEKIIRSTIKRLKVPTITNTCSMDTESKREDINQLVKNISKTFPKSREQIVAALCNPERNNLWGTSKNY